VWPSLKAICVAYAAPLAQLQAALLESSPAFSVDYHPAKLTLAHLQLLKGAVQYVTVLAILNLHEGNAQEAMQNLRALASLARANQSEALTSSESVRASIGSTAIRATWEALQYADWNEKQLAELQR